MMNGDLDQAIADAEWVDRRVQATLAEATRQLEALNRLRHPILWLRMRRALRELRRALAA